MPTRAWGPVERAELAEEVHDLRQVGVPVADVAALLGVSVGSVVGLEQRWRQIHGPTLAELRATFEAFPPDEREPWERMLDLDDEFLNRAVARIEVEERLRRAGLRLPGGLFPQRRPSRRGQRPVPDVLVTDVDAALRRLLDRLCEVGVPTPAD